MGAWNLFAGLEDRALYRSAFSTDKVAFPDLTSGDQLSIQFTLLKRNTGEDYLLTAWERMAAAAYSLRIGLFLTASPYTQLAYQTSFTVVSDDAYAREGVLALDTAAIATALTSVNSLVATFEIEATIGSSDHTVFRKTDVNLIKALIPSGTSSEQPGQQNATIQQVQAQFVPRDGTGSVPCNHILMLGDDGLPYVFTIRNGQPHAEAF